MKITSLEPQRKNKERLNLYVDGVFRSGLDVGTAARLGLYEDKEVSLHEISNIDVEDEYQKCMYTALNLASRRLQSEREYWQKLGLKYDKPLIGRCLDRLRELGYANDKAFAEMWVRERSRNRGRRLLETELIQKGISKEIIDSVLTEINDSSSLEVALTQAKRKYKATSTKEENHSRVMSLLTRRGFSYTVAKQVLDILSDDK